ncbi:MAG: class I SAM-dependent methyltransferase [Rhodospirillales bacterium]|nr:MAG: class I SAM-dependent methyltransferase [Rhodospirillales bacterium]
MTAGHAPANEAVRRFDPRLDFPLVRRLPSGARKMAKRVLTFLPASLGWRIIAATPSLRTWRKTHLNASTPTPSFADREAPYDHLISAHLPPRFCYLEFGCASGNVVKRWARTCPHPQARFFGFDTFTGMPEEWRGLGWRVEAGTWTLGGELPVTDDPRVTFVKGRFQDSLPGFLATTDALAACDTFVIHIDADLYSSALYVLCMLRPLLPKAIVIFDEFDCVLDEFRALEDFCSAFGISYTVLATATDCEKVAIRFRGAADGGGCHPASEPSAAPVAEHK